jgi:DNA polymerase-3 subunit epsilon
MWWDERMAGFDLETTAPLPEVARAVTASIALVGGGEPTVAHDWLADPGVEIPEGATAVHGITTERARAEGVPEGDALLEVVELLFVQLAHGRPLVVFNARYDLTVIDRRCRALNIVTLTQRCEREGVLLLVIDPFVIDKWLDRFRKGSRKLDAICAQYGATLDQAHASDADAIAAARAAWVLGAKGRVVRMIRGRYRAQDLAERAALEREWEACRYELPLLHEAQRRWALAERERFGQYLAERAEQKAAAGDEEGAQADFADAARVSAERGWPVLELMEHEVVG